MFYNACSFTGHREIPPSALPKIREKLTDTISGLISEGIYSFICGGAIGFDTLSADTVLALRKTHPEIKLCLALPCREQDKYFSETQKEDYKRILSLCDSYHYISENYTRGCMHKRNRFMVDNSDYVVAYCTKTSGGSFYTVKYAASKNKKIILIK